MLVTVTAGAVTLRKPLRQPLFAHFAQLRGFIFVLLPVLLIGTKHGKLMVGLT